MGLFPFAEAVPSMLNRSPARAARGRWPEALWRRRLSAGHLCGSFPTPSLSAPFRLNSISPAARPRALNALGRRMDPLVELGPPAAGSG